MTTARTRQARVEALQAVVMVRLKRDGASPQQLKGAEMATSVVYEVMEELFTEQVLKARMQGRQDVVKMPSKFGLKPVTRE